MRGTVLKLPVEYQHVDLIKFLFNKSLTLKWENSPFQGKQQSDFESFYKRADRNFRKWQTRVIIIA